MSKFFIPSSPLGLAVQKLLLENRQGLSVHQIRHNLRHKGMQIEERNLRELLSHPQVFIKLPNDCYTLYGEASKSPSQENPVEAKFKSEFKAEASTPVLLGQLFQAQQEYIVFDLETTGLDPQRDKIIQFVAVRFRAGQPIEALNLYLNPAPTIIPYTLKLKLGLDRQLQVSEAISNGPSLADRAAQIKAFLGDCPLVSHNARFDRSFLEVGLTQNDLSLTNPILDTLEMAVLLYPALPEHRLETLANHLGVDFGAAAALWQTVSTTESNFEINANTLHNAITDTCLLAEVYRCLLQVWYDKAEANYEVRRHLLPEAFAEEWNAELIEAHAWLKTTYQPPARENPAVMLQETADWPQVTTLLERYLVARNYTSRSGQAQMVELVWQSLSGDSFKMIEAPTGTGKTIATLIPALVKALREGERVVVSTAYRNLQDQLLDEIKQLKSLLGLSFQHQVLKGVANYPCYDRLAAYIEELDPQAPLAERYVLAYLVGRARTVPETTLDDLHYWLSATFPEAASVYRAISAGGTAGSCQPRRCGPLGCPLLRVTAGAKIAHLLVVNHDLWLADPDRLPPHSYAILDEAHTLEDVATRVYTTEVSKQVLEEWFDRLRDRRTGHGVLPRLLAKTIDITVRDSVRQIFASLELCRRLVADFGSHLAGFVRACQGKLDPRHGAALRLEADPRRVERTRWNIVEGARAQFFEVHLGDLLNLLQRLAIVLKELGIQADPTLAGLGDELAQISEKLAEQRQWHAEIIGVSNRKFVYWIEVTGAIQESEDDHLNSASPEPAATLLSEKTDRKKREIVAWALKKAPVRVDGHLQARYQGLRAAIIVSATLAIRGGDFEFFADRLGLKSRLGQGNLHRLQGDLDFASQAFLGLANYLDYTPVERTIHSFQEEIAKELQLLLDFTDGRALVLFTARDRMQQVYERCNDYLAGRGIPLYWQAPGMSRRRLQEEFADRLEAVLLGLQSFWEGVDVPGESLSFVIMEKLPFPFLFDPVFKARREEVMERGQHEFQDFIFPLMAIRFKQGFGRLVRTRTDRGAVILLDKRLHRKNYKYDLLASLPGFMPRDETAERNRRAFYEALIARLPGLIRAEAKQELLANLPGSLALDLEARLERYRLPARLTAEEYNEWRPILLMALREIFGHADFRSPEQEAVVRAMLLGQDVLALLPTGAGKSLCFQLTALLREGLTVVFSPLIALMRDQVQNLNARGIEIVSAIYSGQPADEREEILARLRAGKLKLVYISPERLRDPQLLHSLLQAQVTQVVVDEAHCVAMWGPNFRPDFLYLPRLASLLPARPPLAAFTATATPAVRDEIEQALQMHAPQEIVASFDRPELRLVVYNTHSPYNAITFKNRRLAVLLKILEAADRKRESVLIYVVTTVEAELTARRLQQAGYDARAYHGKLSTADRDNVQELFMDDQINIVVCTKAFGMGIDKADIRYVIHCHTPGDLESYYQEAGRAGRDGREAYCVLLYHQSDRAVHDYFLESGLPDEASLARLYAYLQALPGDLVRLDPTEIADRLGLDETGLKIGLHLLEKSGLIERGADFTRRGSLTLFEEPTRLEEAWLSGKPEQVGLLKEAARLLEWPTHRRLEVDLVTVAGLLDTTPEVLDTALIGLAVAGLGLYRPWEKGYLVAKKAQNVALPGSFAPTSPAGQTAKLETMFRYAASGPGGTVLCRRAFVLSYFGQGSVIPCGACDLCAPDYHYPWSELTGRDTASISDYFDLAFTFLEIVKWNLDRTEQGHNPYGLRTLHNILRGNDYAIGKSIPDPALRRWRLRQARDCPYWGIFEGLPGGDKALEDCLQRLYAEGYLEEVTVKFNREEQFHAYTYPGFLPKGRDQLLRGELLNWPYRPN